MICQSGHSGQKHSLNTVHRSWVLCPDQSRYPSLGGHSGNTSDMLWLGLSTLYHKQMLDGSRQRQLKKSPQKNQTYSPNESMKRSFFFYFCVVGELTFDDQMLCCHMSNIWICNSANHKQMSYKVSEGCWALQGQLIILFSIKHFQLHYKLSISTMHLPEVVTNVFKPAL